MPAYKSKLRLTRTQRALLGLLRENNGTACIYSGSRILRMDRGRAQCNEVSIYFLVEYRLMKNRRGADDRPTAEFDITSEGRVAHERGWHDPGETRRLQQAQAT